MNVGTGEDLSIRNLQNYNWTGFLGNIEWDSSKPDGTPKKQLDVTRLAKLGWKAQISLIEGLSQTVLEYQQSYPQKRLLN